MPTTSASGRLWFGCSRNQSASPSPAAFSKLEKQLTGLKHPAIVPILKLIGDSRKGPVIAVVSDHVIAPTLTHWLSQAGQPDLRKAAFFVLVIADALEYSSRRLMIHGSLSPDHILIGDDGKPHITGFELARLDCRPDVSCATVRAYVAPERLQSLGARPTAQADLYSLGVIFYRLLTGALPDLDPSNNPPQSPRAINPQVPVELAEICKKAVAADPARGMPHRESSPRTCASSSASRSGVYWDGSRACRCPIVRYRRPRKSCDGTSGSDRTKFSTAQAGAMCAERPASTRRLTAVTFVPPPQPQCAPGLFAHLDAVGDPLVDDPDDAVLVAHQRHAGTIRATNTPATKEIGQWHALATHPEWLEPIAGYRRADKQWERHSLEVDRLVASRLEGGIEPRIDRAARPGNGRQPGHNEGDRLERDSSRGR